MTQRRLFKILLVGLPIGLVAITAVSFVIYFRGDRGVVDGSGGGDEDGRVVVQKVADVADLERYVRLLSETLGPRNVDHLSSLNGAASFIESTLGRNNMGYDVERQSFEYEGGTFHNIVAELRGDGERRDEVIVVGAHYDSAGDAPGADDNASGVAVLLGLAHSLVGDSQGRTIRFVAFANEEPPFYQTDGMGSRVYAQRCREGGDQIVAMLCLEGLGYFTEMEGSQKSPDGVASGSFPEVGDFLAVVGNLESKVLVDGVVTHGQAAAPALPIEGVALPAQVPWVSASDHSSFWLHGWPAVMITDTALLRNPHYHTAGDTLETLDFSKMVEVVRAVRGALSALANP